MGYLLAFVRTQWTAAASLWNGTDEWVIQYSGMPPWRTAKHEEIIFDPICVLMSVFAAVHRRRRLQMLHYAVHRNVGEEPRRVCLRN